MPLLAAGAFAAGFVLAGGIGAAFRLVFRPRRESRTTLRVGRFAVVDGRR